MENIRILIGESASGKNYYFDKFVKMGFMPIITCTTRPMRDNEKEGVDYFFKSKEEFDKLVKSGDIFEFRKYNTLVNGKKDTWYYGSLYQKIDENKKYVVIADIDGAKAYISKYGKDMCRVVYICSNNELRTRRAKLRPGFDQTEWDRRLEDDSKRFSHDNLFSLQFDLINNTYDPSSK